MKNLPISLLNNVLQLQQLIAKEFEKVTGLTADDCSILYAQEEYQSDCDGDDNKVRVKITIDDDMHTTKPIIDLLKLHKTLSETFDLMPKVTQEITRSNPYPNIKTTCEFDFYSFTKNKNT